jgi:LysM repeat protein
MTERGLPIVDGAPACPFVAFEDDRDERAPAPDHRHRCYAEARPAPRALAHQQAYCLSSSFPVCPTFQDWARREAARTRAAESMAAVDAADEAALDLPPRRNTPREWTAPPPWVGEGHDSPVEGADATPGFLPSRSQPGQGLAGSPADRLAGGEAPEAPREQREWAWEPAREQHDEGLWGRSGPDPLAHRPPDDSHATPPEFEHEVPPERRVRQSAGFGLPLGDRRPRVGQARPRQPVREETGPSWERPRRYEAYPSLRTRVGLPSISMPPLALATVAVVVAALALFFLPALLGIGSPTNPSGASPSRAPSASVPASPVSPTPSAAPTAQVYIVAPGDTLSRIATQFGVTVDEILAANPQIRNPNRIAVGDEITIPEPAAAAPSELEGEEPSPSG